MANLLVDEEIIQNNTNSTDKILEMIGNNNKYQYTVVILLFIISLSLEIGYIGVPVMETAPIIQYTDDNNITYKKLMNYSLCKYNHTLVLNESKSTWVIDYNIYCDKFKVSMLGTLMCLGGLTGTIFVQYLKKFGARFALIIACLINMFSTLLLLFPNVVILYIADFFFGMSNIMSFILRLNIMSEITGKQNRSYFNNLIISGGGTTIIIIYLLFDNNFNWRFIYFGSFILLIISTTLFYFLTVENFRYYYVKGDYPNMLASINYIANFNGTNNNIQLEEELNKLKCLGNLSNKDNLDIKDTMPKQNNSDIADIAIANNNTENNNNVINKGNNKFSNMFK